MKSPSTATAIRFHTMPGILNLNFVISIRLRRVKRPIRERKSLLISSLNERLRKPISVMALVMAALCDTICMD